ncbi:signal peptidase II [Paenibacillus urinalis]|uniref:signal peptidase II n=1 Tax=Paenibacillus urinalis TaxID=521520 RepID=UPI00196227B9
MLFYITAIVILIIDQASKLWVREHMDIGEVIPVGSIVQQLEHYENSGMAFSLFQGYARLFGIVALVFIVLILYYRHKGEIQGRLMNVGAGFLVGGAAGNMVDRFFRGTVTDFLKFSEEGGILNFADIALNVGVLLFIAGAGLSWLRSRWVRRSHF